MCLWNCIIVDGVRSAVDVFSRTVFVPLMFQVCILMWKLGALIRWWMILKSILRKTSS